MVLKQSQKAVRWGWAKDQPLRAGSRFAPLRSPGSEAEKVRPPCCPKSGTEAKIGHEGFSTLSANFRVGRTVGGGECDPQTQGTGGRGAGGVRRHALGVSAVSK